MSTWVQTPTAPSGFGSGEFLVYNASDNAGTWVVASNHTSVWVTTDQGAAWTSPINPDPSDLAGISGMQFLHGLFVLWGPSKIAGNNIYTSPDGVTWTQRASQIGIALTDNANENNGLGAAYGAGLFVIVGDDDGSGNTSVTSPDGITWTPRNVYSSAGGGGLVSITFDGTHFVATVLDPSLSPTNQIAYSTDGAHWTFQNFNTLPGANGIALGVYWFDSKYIVAWGYDDSLNGGLGGGWYETATVLSPWNGAQENLTSTPAGIQGYPLLADDGTTAIGSALNQNDSVNTPVAITTTDGATFAYETTGFEGGELGCVAYDSSLGVFFGVGNNSSSTNVVAIRENQVMVPNIVGDTQAVATSALVGAGLMVGTISSAFNSVIAAGLVFVQAPTAGSSVAPGTSVNFTLSLGPQEVIVPDLIGLTGAVAENTLAAAGLTTGILTGVSDATVPVGSVATQNPDPGAVVLFGSAVDLGISFVVPEFDVDATVISQYANSPTIVALVEDFGEWFDPSANLQSFYLTVWNIDTAVGFGLDIWGIILDVSRVVPIPGTAGAFGFDNSDTPPDWENFGNIDTGGSGGPFFSGQMSGGSYRLDDGPYRTLLLTKALANICATTAPALNALITNLFPGRGRCYTRDLGNMEMSYYFEFALTTIEVAILEFSGVLAHPAGVGVSITVVPEKFFGFEEAGSLVEPFDYGVFYNWN